MRPKEKKIEQKFEEKERKLRNSFVASAVVTYIFSLECFWCHSGGLLVPATDVISFLVSVWSSGQEECRTRALRG